MTHIILRVAAVLITSYITGVGVKLNFLPEPALHSVYIALIVYLFLVVINHFIKPMIHIISLPINILTLGAFSLFINGIVIVVAGMFIPEFQIPSLVMGMWFAFVLSVVNFVLHIFEIRD